jgi:flavin-dependent dehydrogenase
MKNHRTDAFVTEGRARVAIIGAGPAGAAAACTLGRSGIDAFLIERGQPGKDKACGDALLPTAIRLLERYGIDAKCIDSLGGYPFSCVDLYDHGSLLWQRKLDGNTGWIIPRAVLDQELRDTAARYAAVWYGTLVIDVLQELDGSWKITLRQSALTRPFWCDAIVLATGSSNRFAKRWGISGEPIMAASIRAYAEDHRLENPVCQFTEACRPGYGWVFPLGSGRVNIGVCALRPNNIKRLRNLAEDYLSGRGVSRLGKWRGGGGLLWSGRGHAWHHSSGIVSCGDAAGLADPFTGEGITAALLSGERAGCAISMYLRENRHPARLREYSQWVRQHFSQKYRKTLLLQVWAALCGI